MLTPQELETLKKRLLVNPIDSSTFQKKDNSPGYFERVGQQYSEAGKSIQENLQRPAISNSMGASPFEVTKQLGEAALRTTGDVVGVAFAPITEAVAPLINPILKPVVQTLAEIPGVKQGIDKVVDWANKNPNAAKDLGAALNIGLLLTAESSKPLVKSATNKGVETAGKASETLGSGLKSAGEISYRTAIPMEESTARALQSYQASKPTLSERVMGFFTGKDGKIATPPIRESETAARYGLSGTEWQIGVQAKKASNGIWNDTIKPALEASKEKNDMRAFFGDLKDRIISETPDLTRRRLLLRAWESMKSDYSKVNFVSDLKLQEYKSGWAKFVPEKVYKGKPIAGALNDVRNMASQEARSILYQKLGENVKQAYLDYGNLQSIIEAGVKSVDALRSKGVSKQIWEFLVDKTITPISSYGGKVLYKTGEGFEFIGKEGLKKIGDILKN